jgi:hypothetical protein
MSELKITETPLFKPEMSEEDYRAYPAANWSRLKKILDCPLKYLEDDSKKTQAMELGTLLHAVLLDGFDNYINFDKIKEKALEGVCDAKGNLAKNPAVTTEGKAIVKQLAAQYAGYKFCTDEEIEMIEFYKAEFKRNPRVVAILDGAKKELPVFKKISGTEIAGKAKLDVLSKINQVWDLKTFSNMHPKSVQRDSYDRNYHSQICYYAHIAQAAVGGIIGISTTKPYQVSIIEFPEEAIEHATKRIAKAVETLIECQERNSFPGYGNYTLEFPKYLEYEKFEKEEDVF